jgi:hypothetical protein
MKNLDLDNTGHLDESFSNFRAFGIGKPSQKQIDKWEVKKPKKYNRLVAKGKITVAEKQSEPSEPIGDNKIGLTNNNSVNKIADEQKPKNTAIIISGIVGGVVVLSLTLFLIFRKKG